MSNLQTEKYIEWLKDKHGADTAGKLLAYLDMVLERNEHINLTAIRDRDEAVIKHLADSLSIMELPEFWNAENVIDVGTGAGFPGALLAIACPGKSFVLLDSTLKRLRVVEEIAEKLDINNIETVHARAEEVNSQELQESFDLCVSRAVANLTTLSAWCLPFVRKGGSFIAYKGEKHADELEAASAAIAKLGASFDRVSPADSGFDPVKDHVLIIIKK